MADAAAPQHDKTKPSGEIPVTEFRQILIWPLTMEHPALRDGQSWLLGTSRQHVAADCVAATGASLERMADKSSAENHQPHWIRVHDPLQHIADHDNAHGEHQIDENAYAEFVYFHPYVQQFLYQQQHIGVFDKITGDHAVPFYLFRCENVRHTEVDIPIDGSHIQRFYADIGRLNLYLFSSGVALLALEVKVTGVASLPLDTVPDNEFPITLGSPCLSLHDVLLFQERFRRCYAPFWHDDLVPGKVCSRVSWFNNRRTKIISSSYGPDDAATEFQRLAGAAHARDRRYAPVFQHWRDLLPLKLRGYQDDDKAATVWWRHVVDDRMPSMAYIALPDNKLGNISRNDFVRLCFADEPMSSDYCQEFMYAFEENNCYDRFLHHGTRHMFSGYSYSVVCGDTNFQHVLVNHFRRHYFQIALLSQFEYAALLTYDGWISDTVEKHRGKFRSRQFEQDIMRIEEEMMSFTHRFSFTDLSNHLQARELHQYWRKHLGLDRLHDRLKDELKTATDYLFQRDQAEQTVSSNRLSVVAVIAAVLGLPMAFLGMNFVGDGAILGGALAPNLSSASVYFGLTALSASVGAVVSFVSTSGRRRMAAEWSLLGFLGLIAIGSLVGFFLTS